MGKIIWIVLFSILPVRGEYRAYRYYLKWKERSSVVTSTLDPISFVAYNGGVAKIDLLDSWMCKGHTGNMRRICPSPIELIPFQPQPSGEETSPPPAQKE